MSRTITIVFLLLLFVFIGALLIGMPPEMHDITVRLDDGSYEIHNLRESPWLWVFVPLVLVGVAVLLVAVFAGVGILLVVTMFVVAGAVLIALIPVLVPVVLILALPVLAIYGLVKLFKP